MSLRLPVRTPLWPLLALLAHLGGCTTAGTPMDSGGGADLGSLPPGDGATPPADQAPDAPLGPPVRISVGTFNVRNLFDEAADPDKKDTVLSTSEVEAKLREVGAALRKLDVDVVALQEIENKTLLKRLNDGELSSLGYDVVRLIEGNDIRGADVAVLSRHPITGLRSHTQDRFKGIDGDPYPDNYGFSRDCLEVTVEPSPGRRLVLLVNHLRAHDGTTEADYRRYAQAKRVREIADELLGRAPLLNLAVLGDLNDEPDTKTLSLIRSGSAPLRDAAEALAASERWTTSYKGDKQQFDYILLSAGLEADLVGGSVMIDRAGVFSATSDHFPVRAEFLLE